MHVLNKKSCGKKAVIMLCTAAWCQVNIFAQRRHSQRCCATGDFKDVPKLRHGHSEDRGLQQYDLHQLLAALLLQMQQGSAGL